MNQALYLQPHTADTGPALIGWGHRAELDPVTALDMLITLAQYLGSRRVVVLERKEEPAPVSDV